MKKTFYIVDISSFFFRSYYAIPGHMTSKEGLPTNAIYGALSMVLRLIKTHKPDHIVFCFDTKYPSFRKKLFKAYKANRGEMPEDLAEQVPQLKKMTEVLNIKAFEKKGYEADDLIGTLVQFGKKHKLKNFIVSGDKDFAQLVDENTVLLDTMKSKTYDIKGVREKWGISPLQMIDYQALVGDSSDNIPGVRGVGPKGAVSLLNEYKTLDKIYSNIDKIQGTLQKKLKEGKKECLLSKKLVTIVKDVNIPCKLSDVTYKEPKKKEFIQFLENLDFKTFLQEYGEKKPPVQKKKSTRKDQALIKTKWTDKDIALEVAPYASVWIWEKEEKLHLGYKNYIAELDSSNLKEISQVLDSKYIRWCGYDLKTLWQKLNITKPIVEWDAIVAGHLLDSKPSQTFSSLCKKYGESLEENEENIYKIHQRLRATLEEKVEKEDLAQILYKIEFPLIAVLYGMEKEGILLDIKEIKKQSSGLESDLKNIEKKVFSLCKEEFNLASPKQLGEILFEKLKLPKGKKTKTGWSTDNKELVKLKNLHSVIPLVLNYRELFKLKTTYTDAFLNLVDPKTKRIHTQFKQTTTSTGRLSSVHPNLQNIPIKTERGRSIRKVFIASPQNFFVSADYSQIELRILAHISEDKNLCQAFYEDLDIHAITASEVFNVPLKDVTPELRRKSKAVNFGIAYGQGPYGLAESLGIPRSEGKEIIENYFKKFKGVKTYIERTIDETHSKGYVKTLFGRKRFFESWELKNPQMRAAAERAAINAPIQGTASDIVKKAMIDLEQTLSVPILSQVHDELLFECPKDQLEEEKSYIISLMENCVKLKVPLKVNLSYGAQWAEAHS